MAATGGLFVPGWGAPAGLYAAGIPAGWEVLELPSYQKTRGDLLAYRRWLEDEVLRRRTPVVLAGHSMGGALALLFALERPELVQRLTLVSPAGLPLTKRMRASIATFAGQVVRGRYPFRELCRMVARTGAAPWSALRLARTVHQLDVRPEVERLSAHGVPCTVVGCATDTLATCAHCRELAAVLDAEYREVVAPDGHIWPIAHPRLLAAELSR